jgi:hypothetical protein
MNVASSTLGVPGYTFADLHDPTALSLYERFCEEVATSDPDLWRDWDAIARRPMRRGCRWRCRTCSSR